jgi:hypothetical protein
VEQIRAAGGNVAQGHVRLGRPAEEIAALAQESMNTFMQMFNIPHSYLQAGMRLSREDTPGSPQERSTGRDPKEDQYRRSAGQSS